MAVIQFLHIATEIDFIEKLAGFLYGGFSCLGIVWLIVGLVMRYNETGKTCSGDYVLGDGA